MNATPIRFEYYRPNGDPTAWWGRLYFDTEEGRDAAYSAIIRGARALPSAEWQMLAVEQIVANYTPSKFGTLIVQRSSVATVLALAAEHEISCHRLEALPEDLE